MRVSTFKAKTCSFLLTGLAFGGLLGACDNSSSGDQGAGPGVQDKTPAPDSSAPDKSEPEVSGLGIGQECKSAQSCTSGHCVKVMRRGPDHPPKLVDVCSECEQPSDCPQDRPHCVYDLEQQAKVCGDGSLGQLCKDQTECSGETNCALVNLGDNKIPLQTCAECILHSDCSDPAKPLCITLPPTKKLRPHNQCAAEGSRKNGDVCFPCETGDRECGGFCVRVKIPGKNFCVGVCGECRTDADCQDNEVCSKPELNMGSDGSSGNNVPSKCVAKG